MTQVCDLMCVLCVALNKREQCDFVQTPGLWVSPFLIYAPMFLGTIPIYIYINNSVIYIWIPSP